MWREWHARPNLDTEDTGSHLILGDNKMAASFTGLEYNNTSYAHVTKHTETYALYFNKVISWSHALIKATRGQL